MTYFHLNSAGRRSNGNSEILAKIDVRASSLIDVLANLTSDQLWRCVVIHCTADGEGVPRWHASFFSSLLALVVGITHINPMQIPANKQSKGVATVALAGRLLIHRRLLSPGDHTGGGAEAWPGRRYPARRDLDVSEFTMRWLDWTWLALHFKFGDKREKCGASLSRKRNSSGTIHFLIISEMMLNGWQNEKGAAGRDFLLTLSQVKRVQLARSSLLGNLLWTWQGEEDQEM